MSRAGVNFFNLLYGGGVLINFLACLWYIHILACLPNCCTGALLELALSAASEMGLAATFLHKPPDQTATLCTVHTLLQLFSASGVPRVCWHGRNYTAQAEGFDGTWANYYSPFTRQYGDGGNLLDSNGGLVPAAAKAIPGPHR